jgi:hypothetical protein
MMWLDSDEDDDDDDGGGYRWLWFVIEANEEGMEGLTV